MIRGYAGPTLSQRQTLRRFPMCTPPRRERSPRTCAARKTQKKWITEFGKGLLDDHAVFFPVTIDPPATQPVGTVLSVAGAVQKPLNLTDADWKKASASFP